MIVIVKISITKVKDAVLKQFFIFGENYLPHGVGLLEGGRVETLFGLLFEHAVSARGPSKGSLQI